jgi:hypothetical protein
MMTSLPDRLGRLARPDKWYLSAGDGILWAPPFPVWLHRPGFWDEAMVCYHPFAPLFGVALVDGSGREIALRRARLEWVPGRLTAEWTTPDDMRLRESRVVEPGGLVVSAWTVPDALATHSLIAFTAQPGPESTGWERLADGVTWRRRLTDRRGGDMDVAARLSSNAPGVRVAAYRTEPSVAQPSWELTPFPDHWDGAPPDQVRLEGIDDTGLVFAAVAAPLSTGCRDPRFSLRLAPPHPPTGGSTVSVFAERFPRFACDDPFLERYFDYRVAGLHLNRLGGAAGHVRYPAVAEGIGYFHVPITYSAQCHMMEMRWARDPEEAYGSLLNFIESQKPDGSFHGRLYTTHLEGTDFYHANWGDAVLAVDSVAPNAEFLARAYDGLTRYARWLDATRDREQSGMYDVVDQFETGQEYMSRYQAVDVDADRYGWENRIRLKGIDVTVYAYQLKRALALLATRLGHATHAGTWRDGAERTGEAIRTAMWDDDVGLFSDVDPRTMRRTGVKAAVCFYPLLTDLLDDDAVRRLMAHLENPAEFAAPFPIPSSSLDDPRFAATAEWKGKRHNCPWNGRVWPMTNSHVIEGLLRQWHAGRRFVGPLAARLLTTFVHMMFHDGDLGRPNCFEHYDPLTGRASVYRGIDDYQHSWVLDLLLRGVAGLEPRADALVVDPLPCPVAAVEVSDALIRGHTVAFTRQGHAVAVTVDGATHGGTVGNPLVIPW